MPKFIEFLKRNDELLGIIVGILTSLAVLLKTVNSANPWIQRLNINLLTDSINIFVLVTALYFIKKIVLNVEDDENKSLCADFNLDTNTLNTKITRTNTLVNQLTSAIRWFVIVLLGFYGIQFFMDYSLIEHYEEFEPRLLSKDNISIVGLLQILPDEVANASLDLYAAKFLIIEILSNSANLFSATFLFTAFLVLFSITLESDHKTWRIRNQIPLAIAILITVVNILVFTVGIKFGEHSFNLKETSTTIRLIGGLYNGIAMALLFSRFISMEYYFQHSDKNFERSFYLYGITLGLPLYIVVQPLYALFNAVDIEAAAIFKSVVFLICFWGKLVFLFFIYTMLRKKWIHSYILLSLIQNDNLAKMSLELEDVEKLKIKTNANNG